MASINELYRQVVLDHNRSPRHFGELAPPCQHVDAYNALCGDKLTIYLRRDNQQLTELSFTGTGCALSQASASMMTEALTGLNQADALALAERFANALQSEEQPPAEAVDQLPEDLMALLEARAFPSRINCVLLGWSAVADALNEGDDS